MIEWNTSNVKPCIDTMDNFRNFHGFSARVVVRIIDNYNVVKYSFATYHYGSEVWAIEGFIGAGYEVTHWSSLNEPSSACFQPVGNSNSKF